jgi:hypothetical protein
MQIVEHIYDGIKIAEIISNELIVWDISDGLNLLGELYFKGFGSMIVYEMNITPDFFNLNTGIAGEILQKFSNYRVRLVIIGDFSKYESKSLSAFIYESNKGKQISFVSDQTEAIKVLTE